MLNRHIVLSLLAGGIAACTVAPVASAATNDGLIYVQQAYVPDGKDKDLWPLRGDIRAIAPDGSNDRPVITTRRHSEAVPAVSPDGQTLVFTRDDELWRSAIDGSGATLVREDDELDTPAWAPDGSSVAYSMMGGGRDDLGGLALVGPLVPGAKRRIAVRGELSVNGEPIGSLAPGELDRDEVMRLEGVIPFAPEFTADGRRLVYIRGKIEFNDGFGLIPSVWTANLDGTESRRLFRGSGTSRLILDFSLSPDGTQIAYIATSSLLKEPRRLLVANLDGSGARQLAFTGKRWSFGRIAWSPDRTRVAAGVNHENTDRGAELWSIDVATGAHTVLKKIAKGQIDDPAWVAAP